MQLAMHNYRTDLSQALRQYVERRLRFALDRFGRRVSRATVRVCPDGPTDSLCSISIEVEGFGRIAVEEIDADLFAAIDRATGRIGRLLGRELERARCAKIGRESVRLVA